MRCEVKTRSLKDQALYNSVLNKLKPGQVFAVVCIPEIREVEYQGEAVVVESRPLRKKGASR